MSEIQQRLKQGPMHRLQILTIGLCVLINMLDGFDVLVMAFAAPSLSNEWQLSAAALGGLLSAGLIGMALGSLFLSPLADRVGRRNTILLALLIMTIGMLLSALATAYWQLMAMRVLTGLALGSALASLNTMVAEYASAKYKNLAVACLQAGYPVGATLGGLASAALIGQFGWPSLFVFGGVLSLLMLPLIAWLMPESLDYLEKCQPRDALLRINQILARMQRAPIAHLSPRPIDQIIGGKIAALLAPALRRNTLFVWLSFFCLMLSFYFVLSWTPKLLVDAGMSVASGISGSVVMNLGGIIGGLALGWWSARAGLRGLIGIFMLLTAVVMAVFASVTQQWQVLLVVAWFIGFFIFGSMIGLYALTPDLYATEIRNTGMGWAIGIGRLGAIVGPTLAGQVLSAGWSAGDCFLLFALPMLLAAAAVMMVNRDSKTAQLSEQRAS